MQKIREGGVEELKLVKSAYLEDDGEISVICSRHSEHSEESQQLKPDRDSSLRSE